MNWLLLPGSLYPTSMRISEEGRLVVNFKTEARFHGLFVMSHPGKLNLHFSSTVKSKYPSQVLYYSFFLFLLLIPEFVMYRVLQVRIFPLLVISYLSLMTLFRLSNLVKYTLIQWKAHSSICSRARFMKGEDLGRSVHWGSVDLWF